MLNIKANDYNVYVVQHILYVRVGVSEEWGERMLCKVTEGIPCDSY
jgi:hypothetical protein